MKRLLLIMMLLVGFVGSSFAGKTYTWDGSVDSSWTVAGNWTPGGGADPDPANGDAADFIIDGTYADAPVITSTPVGFDMENCEISGNSLVQIRGGTVTFDGDLGVYGGSDLILTGGELNVTGSLYLFDAGSSIIVAGGDLNVSGDIVLGNDGPATNGTDGSTIINLSNGEIRCTNLVFDDQTGDDHSVTISGGSLITSGDVRSDGEDVNINITSASAFLDINGNLNMTGGNDLLTMSNGVLRLDGNWNNSGTSNISGGTVRLEGIGSQSITGNTTFSTLRVLNSIGGIDLNDSILIGTRMRMFNGIIRGNGNSVTFLDNATATDANSASFIDGPINKIGNDPFTFPTGDGVFYLPISISNPNTTLDMYRAEYFRVNPNGLYSLLSREPTIATASQLEYWQLDRLIGTSAETVTLSWSLTSLVGSLLDLKVVRWDDNDGEWKDHGNGGTTGNTSAGTVSSSGTIADFSPFTLGSGSPANPLPVELINFNVKQIGDYVLIDWSTSAEINNNRFEIQKTVDGKNIETIATVNSKANGGNSTENLYYSLHDPIDFSESAYYRLIQYDHDGKSKTYPFLAVHLANTYGQQDLSKPIVYPNPIVDGQFKVKYSSEEAIDYYLFGMNGQSVRVDQQQLSSDTYRISILENLGKGIYFLNVVERKSSKTISTEKLIIQ